MTTLAACRAALESPRVRAFLRLIRERESGQGDDAYTVINGGAHFTAPPWAHPWPDGTPTTQGGRAAGAYQFLPSTWKRVAEQLSLPDFSPEAQDIGAVYLIAGRGALDDVLAGRIEDAVAKCRKEWTSLPGAAESSAGWTMAKAWAVYQKWGGDTQPAAPIEDRSRPHVPDQPEKPMPIFAALLPSILQLIPGLISVFGKSERAQTNAKAAQMVTDAIVAAVPSAPNLQAAVEAMQADKEVAKAAAAKVMESPAVSALVEVGGGIDAAHKRNMEVMAQPQWWRPLLSPAFVVSLILLGIVIYVIVSILGNADVWRPEDRSQILMLVVAITSGVMGFYLGSSLGSQRKDDALMGK